MRYYFLVSKWHVRINNLLIFLFIIKISGYMFSVKLYYTNYTTIAKPYFSFGSEYFSESNCHEVSENFVAMTSHLREILIIFCRCILCIYIATNTMILCTRWIHQHVLLLGSCILGKCLPEISSQLDSHLLSELWLYLSVLSKASNALSLHVIMYYYPKLFVCNIKTWVILLCFDILYKDITPYFWYIRRIWHIIFHSLLLVHNLATVFYFKFFFLLYI